MNCCCCATQTECCYCEPRRDQKKTSLFRRMMGPSPDEVLMNALDSLLMMLATGPSLPSLVSCPPPLPPAASCPPPPRSSPACSLGRSSSYHSINCSSCDSRTRCFKCPSSRLSAASSSPRQRSPHVDFTHPADDIRKRQKAGSFSRLQQAEMACSVACDALKARLKPKKSPRSDGKDKNGLWTRLRHTKNGCQVYEVYKDSNAECSPSKVDSKAPAIVFLVLKNGNIMPFEAITSV